MRNNDDIAKVAFLPEFKFTLYIGAYIMLCI